MSDSEEIDMEDMNRVHGRVLRNRKYRRPFEDSRADKRLFTPEIKRHLKSWLIRRRENPYPNREEKKELAVQTGLTYIQICNWFANWRRKLKNSGRNVNKFTWSTLIKSYNNQIIGNLEHLSISSDDSIWEEGDLDQPQAEEKEVIISQPVDHSYTSLQSNFPSSLKMTDIDKEPQSSPQSNPTEQLPQCFQISSTTDFIEKPRRPTKGQLSVFGRSMKTNRKSSEGNNLRDKNWNYPRISNGELLPVGKRKNETNPVMLSKWKRSAACFRPSCKSYLVDDREASKSEIPNKAFESCHDREELDAAEALTSLSRTTQINATDVHDRSFS